MNSNYFAFCIKCVFILFFSLFLFSCSNENQSADLFDESDTLRFTAEKLYSTTNWTEELEKDRLTTSVSAIKGVSSKLNLSPLIVVASVPEEDSAVFPKLENFGSLDTSLLPSALKSALSSFCEAISKNDDAAAENAFKKENLYSLGLFYLDFKRIFNDAYKIDEYEKSLAEWKVSQKSDSKDSPASDEEKTPEIKKPEIVFFDKYVFGTPFLDGIYYEIPVLLIGKKASLTLCVFCFEESGNWKIDQVQMSDWEIF